MFATEANKPVRASITGIDGAGKSTTLALVVDDLKQDNRIVKATNRPVYSVVGGTKEYHYRRLIGLIDMLHGFADQTHNPNYVCAVNAAHVVLQGRIIEPTLERRIKPTIVLGARDLMIDPAVYAVCYSPRLARKNMSDRISFIEQLTGAQYRDVIFFLTVPPEEAVSRIEGRIEAENASLAGVERPKWRHMHENPRQLNLLQHEYYDALDEVKKRSGVDIVTIDTLTLDQTEVALLICNEIRKRQNMGKLSEPIKA